MDALLLISVTLTLTPTKYVWSKQSLESRDSIVGPNLLSSKRERWSNWLKGGLHISDVNIIQGFLHLYWDMLHANGIQEDEIYVVSNHNENPTMDQQFADGF